MKSQMVLQFSSFKVSDAMTFTAHTTETEEDNTTSESIQTQVLKLLTQLHLV